MRCKGSRTIAPVIVVADAYGDTHQEGICRVCKQQVVIRHRSSFSGSSGTLLGTILSHDVPPQPLTVVFSDPSLLHRTVR